MAEPRKTRRTPATPARRKAPQGESHLPVPIQRPTVPDDLTPEGLKRQWALAHPDRPEVRAALERLYRRQY